GSSPWKWRCDSTNPDDPKCLKELEGTDASETSLERCKLTCGPSGALWPRPREVTLSNSVSYFLPANIALFISASPDISSLLNQAFALALESIDMYNPNYVPGEDYWTGPWDSDVEDHKLIVEVSVQSLEEFLTLDTNEMYTLAVNGNYTHTVVQITAQTFFGARHGMETFTQLIDFEEETNSLQVVNSVYITDSPTYSYRGLTIDTSRNFIPVEDLKRTLNAMSYSKLNTLHWHITDSHSFPLNLDNLPNMAYYGAYSSSQTYSSSDVKDLILYARLRGIRILPEIDAPAQVGNGWQWGEAEGLGSLVVCFNKVSYHIKRVFICGFYVK
ncbi:UNVERIFIED_CONTAM: hypothetical protein GTU68_064569, partial [Idotea baltica]|nr:hypothetical protein [Idotea baltica]